MVMNHAATTRKATVQRTALTFRAAPVPTTEPVLAPRSSGVRKV
jgi:hypothetical protein